MLRKKWSILFLGILMLSSLVYAQTGDTAAEAAVAAGADSSLWVVWAAVAVAALVLVFAWFIFRPQIMKESEGDKKMQAIASYVHEGAMTYIIQQYKIVAVVFILAFGLFVLQWKMGLGNILMPIAFLFGGMFSALAGYIGMDTATKSSARTANGAKESLNKGLQIAFRAGSIMGLTVVGLSLLNIGLWYIFLTTWAPKLFPSVGEMSNMTIALTMLSLGVGASLQALFARVGGGIYTKAADVGADLVGKVEAGIPEDDPRNPATIADNVGDNVGDVAGMGADLFESFTGSILASAALGIAAGFGPRGFFLPLLIAAFGTLVSLAGVFLVRVKGDDTSQKNLLHALHRGVSFSTVLVVLGAIVIPYLLFNTTAASPFEWIGLSLAIITGLLVGWAIGKFTEFYTSTEYKPCRKLAEESKTGPATIIIGGLALGMQSNIASAILVGLGIILSYAFAGGFNDGGMTNGLFGVGLAAVGMLSTLGITLATDAYGPIADNAGGNAEMTNQKPFVRERTDALDALGNTTAATGKGFAIGSATLTAMALIATYISGVQDIIANIVNHAGIAALPDTIIGMLNISVQESDTASVIAAIQNLSLIDFINTFEVHLMNPKVIVGLFTGAMLTMAFCALTMKAVGRAAGGVVEEVRRQFREIKGILSGKKKPDYKACVSIVTKSAQREMIIPSLLAIIAPIFVGWLFGLAGVIGLLIGGLTTGFVMAIMMANAGGAWDNAKKYIEAGHLTTLVTKGKKTVEVVCKKGSFEHKAAVVGDTVGDPFKDTSGPALNILIKLMSMVSVVFAGFVLAYGDQVTVWIESIKNLIVK